MHGIYTALLAFFLPTITFAIVDMRTANLSDTWVDLDSPSTGYQLQVRRTYNSRTLFNGIFGFGWCSDYETKLEITAEGNVKLIECGGGQEIDYVSGKFNAKSIQKTIATIVAEVKKRNKNLGSSYLKKLKSDLKTDTFLREEFARQLNLKGTIKGGVTYYANGRLDETIVLKNKVYVRTLADGTFQRFNLKGQLVKMSDRNGNFLTIKYKKSRIIEVKDNNGRKLNFKYAGSAGKVKSIVGPNGLKVTYQMVGENLMGLTNAWGNKYTYKYDDLHNLLRINFPDKTYKAITYNKDKDWVVSFRDRKGCVEKYTYKGADKKVLDRYVSSVEKKCKNKVTNTSSFEFINKENPYGPGRYLHKAVSTINGKKSEIVYHPKFGKPTSVFKNNQRVSFDYLASGLLAKKKEPTRELVYQYKNSCKKVSSVDTRYFQWGRNKKKKRVRTMVRKIKTDFDYDKGKCNLVFAKNSLGQTVNIGYDTKGRIATIKDQAKKVVKIQYESKFGKPSKVTRPGLGTINVKYKKSGEIDKIDSKQGPTVAIQVASIFNNLLDIIAPATSELKL